MSAGPDRSTDTDAQESDANDGGGRIESGNNGGSGRSELRRERTWQDSAENGATSFTRQTRRADSTDGPEFWPSGHRRIAYDGAVLPDPAARKPHAHTLPPPAFGRSPTASRLSVKQRPPVTEPPLHLAREPTAFAGNSYLEHHKNRSHHERCTMADNLAELFKVRFVAIFAAVSAHLICYFRSILVPSRVRRLRN